MEGNNFEKHLKKAITAEERNKQKAYLQSIEFSLKKTNQKNKFNWRFAASIALFIGLGSYFILFNQTPSNDELYAKHLSPYENVVAPIVRDKVNLTKKAIVFSLYEQGEYKKAIDGFNQLTINDSINVNTITFYKANSYLQLNNFENAKTLFTQAKNKEWEKESLWYLALISIKLNNKDAALNYLKELQSKNNFKKKEINEIINSLK